jgi:hypothetical protein
LAWRLLIFLTGFFHMAMYKQSFKLSKHFKSKTILNISQTTRQKSYKMFLSVYGKTYWSINRFVLCDIIKLYQMLNNFRNYFT